MKIIVLSTCYPVKNGENSCIFVHQQMKALKEIGCEIHVIQPGNWFPPFGLHKLHSYWRTGIEQHTKYFNSFEGITIHHPRVFKKMPSRWFTEHSWDTMGKAIGRYILRKKHLRDADIIYAQFLIHEGYVGTLVKRITGIPLASISLGDDVHAWPEQNPSYIPFLKTVLNKSDLVLSNSKNLAKDTEGWGKDEENLKVKCIYQGIDLEKFIPANLLSNKQPFDFKAKFNLEKGKKYIVCVATPVRLKGWLELLDAWQHVSNNYPNWVLTIVAPSRKNPDALNLVEEVNKRIISDKVRFLGAVSHNNDMPDLLRAVDAFILPSYNEGLSNAVLEAMASGLPVITTDVGGHNEVIEHGKNGYLIQPQKKDDIIAGLQLILGNDKYRESLASNAREGALKIGDYYTNANKLINLFEEVVKK